MTSDPTGTARSQPTEASGTRARDLLAGAPAAIAGGTVCANDQVAFGVRAEVEATGLRCPRDIAVTGYDDSPAAEPLRAQ